ncbi:MAG TPA: hypothetical protein VE934_07045 [Polaromonas sp.]|uniref:hypothetical protein n=1 Tax=Polaromonas sp. TaxID=1869339 RepID=UPI002D31027A|nr:hypothetical protein [Polaromonas sp.]HYW56697.1 hypothetical protein [Polaromonas sp.]
MLSNLIRKMILLALLLPQLGLAQQWKDAPAYDKKNADNVLRRSVFFLPLFGATYREKFEILLKKSCRLPVYVGS